jgi:hypothetical protein
VHSGASGVQSIDTVVFMLVRDRYRFQKKCAEIRYNELVFLHPVGSVCQVVLCSAFGARNVDALFFLLGWDRYVFRIPVRLGRKSSTQYFSCSSGTSAVFIKSASGQVTLILCYYIQWDMQVT